MASYLHPPVGWGDDPLTHFQATAILNEYATFAHQPDWQHALTAVNIDLNRCTNYAIENMTKVDDPTGLLLFATAHNHFLAAVRMVAAGQCLAVYPVSRASVESALYGWYIGSDTNKASRWNSKPSQDRERMRTWNSEFKFSSLCKALSVDSPSEAKWATYLHQSAIDMGAHPNFEALYTNMSSKETPDGGTIIEMKFLHPWGPASMSATKCAIETGMFVLRLFSLAFAASEPVIGIKANALTHVRRLQALVKSTGLSSSEHD
ncbi:hypothetical protein QYH69_15770 [Paraburkholderia sp. SARCC-3016]|uniref:hypothetical protein n=1 Tax=Paraburkholderia sp. SARCC-3016 TaxID=3058611 RepID=UPI002808C150|nr:hypothetical protein [Paraburkholderia sp. SARCC-3016]MDQ7978709.1 hypothetical protein [Paraburkholderia sp. SARCC-3016]